MMRIINLIVSFQFEDEVIILTVLPADSLFSLVPFSLLCFIDEIFNLCFVKFIFFSSNALKNILNLSKYF